MSSSRRCSVGLAALAALALLPLLAWDLAPARFPSGAHDALGAAPLAAIALAYLAVQVDRRPTAGAWVRSAIVAAAFLAWAANQLWSKSPTATAWNDLAIALFVIDIVIAIFDRGLTPAPAP